MAMSLIVDCPTLNFRLTTCWVSPAFNKWRISRTWASVSFAVECRIALAKLVGRGTCFQASPLAILMDRGLGDAEL